MSEVQIQIGEQLSNELSQTESSIQQWSVRVAQALINLRGLENTVKTLYDRRQGLVRKALQEAGVESSRVVSVLVSDDGRSAVVTIGAPVAPHPPTASESGDPAPAS